MTYQSLAEKYVYLGAAFLYTGVTINDSGRVTLTRSEDPRGLVPLGIPRPTTGTYLGWTEGGVLLVPGITIAGDKVNGSTVESNPKVTEQKPLVTCRLQLTNDRTAIKIATYPPGYNTGTGFKTGSVIDVSQRNLFVIICNRFDPNFALARLYYNGYFVPTTWNTGGLSERQAIDMTYTVTRGYKTNTTCLNELLWEEWDFNIWTLEEGENPGVGNEVPDFLAPTRSDWYAPYVPSGAF